MKKIISVSKYEYLHHVSKTRFWLILFGVPLAMLAIFAITFLLSYLSFDKSPVAYIDRSNLISQPQTLPENQSFFNDTIPLLAYQDEAKARVDVENGTLQAYFVIPSDFQSTYTINFFANKQVDSNVTSEIRSFIHENLLLRTNIEHLDRIEAGSVISLQSLDGSELSDGNGMGRILVPILISMLYFILVRSGSGYLLQSLVEEKQNRTMEIMITSMTPKQLMLGKIIGNLGLGFTQIAVWLVLGGLAIFLFRDRLAFLGNLTLSGSYLAISILTMLLSFIVVAGLFTIIGATMSSMEEGNSISGLIILPMMMPFYFVSTYFSNPNGLIPRILSYIPISAPLSLSLRMTFTTVPTWEILLIFAILLVSIVLVFWISGKAFRRGLLEYNKRLNLRDIFAKEVK